MELHLPAYNETLYISKEGKQVPPFFPSSWFGGLVEVEVGWRKKEGWKGNSSVAALKGSRPSSKRRGTQLSGWNRFLWKEDSVIGTKGLSARLPPLLLPQGDYPRALAVGRLTVRLFRSVVSILSCFCVFLGILGESWECCTKAAIQMPFLSVHICFLIFSTQIRQAEMRTKIEAKLTMPGGQYMFMW